MLAVTLDMGLNDNNTGLKQTFFQFIKSALTNMAHHGLLDDFVQIGIDRWTQSDTFMNGLVVKMRNRPKRTERVKEIINQVNSNKHEDLPIEREWKLVALD